MNKIKKEVKEIEELSNTINHRDLRTQCPKINKNTSFSRAHRAYSRTHNMSGYKLSPKRLEKIEIIQHVFSSHNGITLQINKQRKIGYSQICGNYNNTLLTHWLKKSQELFHENYKTRMKKTKRDKNGKTSHAHKLEELIWLKWPYLPKQSTDSMHFLSKCQWNGKTNPETHVEPQNNPITEEMLNKKNKARGIKLPDFKIYCKVCW